MVFDGFCIPQGQISSKLRDVSPHRIGQNPGLDHDVSQAPPVFFCLSYDGYNWVDLIFLYTSRGNIYIYIYICIYIYD